MIQDQWKSGQTNQVVDSSSFYFYRKITEYCIWNDVNNLEVTTYIVLSVCQIGSNNSS